MFTAVIGRNNAFRKAVAQVCRVSTWQTPVLICGEPGTGKELLARIIHERSARRGLPFLAINCDMLSEVLQEDGSPDLIQEDASRANRTIAGILQSAKGGTLYLKNLETLGSGLQEALVPYLAHNNASARSAKTTGSMTPRILAAATIPLDVLERRKVFHKAFYELMAQCAITIPPLRERDNDVVLLARYFAQVYGRQSGRTRVELSDVALSRLLAYDWPGNVQELEETIVRTCAMSCADAHDQPPPHAAADKRMRVVRAQSELGRSGLSFRLAKAQAIEQFERDYLSRLMSDHRGNVSGAARSARTERRTFQRLLRKYGLDRADFLKSA